MPIPSLPPALPLLLAALLAPIPARAQDRPVYPGDRVRITAERTWTGFVQWVTPDSIGVIDENTRGPARPVALAGMERLEIAVGRKSTGKAFLVGGAIGAGAAAGVAAIIGRLQACDDTPTGLGGQTFCERVGIVAIGGSAIAGFAVGGGAGAVLGQGVRWEVAAEPARTGLATGPGLRVGLSVPF